MGVRLAGEAVNLVTPTAAVGGDLLKAYLLRPGVALREGLASVIADKTTSVVSQVLLLLIRLVVGLLLPPPSALTTPPWRCASWAVRVTAVAWSSSAGWSGAAAGCWRASDAPNHGWAVLAGTDSALRSLYFGTIAG